ncbi:MAG: hypothetical protein [Bacteriophage sp.]|nr:MAG: hypothetical protein [Bacteriophage sp.]
MNIQQTIDALHAQGKKYGYHHECVTYSNPQDGAEVVTVVRLEESRMFKPRTADRNAPRPPVILIA